MDLRVLILSDGPNLDSGYGKLARWLGTKSTWNVAFGSFQHVGKPLYYQGRPVYSATSQAMIDYLIKEFQPDIVLHIRDPVVHTRYFQNMYTFTKYKNVTKVVGYIMVMYDYYNAMTAKAIFENYHHVAVPTVWGKRVLTSSGVPTNMMSVIKPWAEICTDTKEIDVPDNYLLFIAVNDDRRKNTVAVLDMLRRTDYNLVLISASGAYNIEEIVERYGLQKRVYYPVFYVKGLGMDDRELAYIYKNAQAYVSLSVLEGINLPPLEMLKYGGRVLLSDIPVHRELYHKYANFVPTRRGYSDLGGLYWQVDVDSAVKELEQLMAKQKVRINDYTTEEAIASFEKTFREILD
ncbi:MAG: glycosyltransferase [Candidatus Micrarchaeaceae archaeon]